MKKTIPLYWDPQDGTEKIKIGSAVVDDETFEVDATIGSSVLGVRGLQRRLQSPFLDISLSAPIKFGGNPKDMMPPHTVLSEDAKISFRSDDEQP